jgi:hypothetical protein
MQEGEGEIEVDMDINRIEDVALRDLGLRLEEVLLSVHIFLKHTNEREVSP